jgi:hypothetical protein
MSILTDSLRISSKGLQSSHTSPPQVLHHLREIGLASFVVHLLPLSQYPLIWTWWSAQKMGQMEKAFFLSVAYPQRSRLYPLRGILRILNIAEQDLTAFCFYSLASIHVSSAQVQSLV